MVDELSHNMIFLENVRKVFFHVKDSNNRAVRIVHTSVVPRSLPHDVLDTCILAASLMQCPATI